MKVHLQWVWSLFISIALILLVVAPGTAQRRSQKRKNPPRVATTATSSTDEPEENATGQTEVRLRLVDGKVITVEEAWESPNGIWYRQGGMSNLIPQDRVKGIERGVPAVRTQTQMPVNPYTDVTQEPGTEINQPVWIHLVGGARVEADSATESTAGVWYSRGPLSIFIERSRIDRIEREDPQTVAKAGKERGWSTGRSKIDALIRLNGAKYGVDPYLIFCVMEQESHFNAGAVSPKGARGLMQLMPGTAARFGVRRPFDPAQNIAGGTRYLKQLMQRFNGRVDLVLASYNAGEGAVARFGNRVPPYSETRNYVKRISYRYGKGGRATSQPSPKAQSVGGR